MRSRASRISHVAGPALALALCGCNAAPPVQNAAEPSNSANSARELLDGYGSIKFGSSFQDAIRTLGGSLFNSAAVSDCYRDLPLRGCYLSRNMSGTPFEMRDGIPYTLSLSFNRYDKLTDIGLDYDREGDITRADCLHIHERTLDWVTREYGPMRFRSGTPEPTNQPASHRTAGGNPYELGSGRDGFFVTAPMRTVSPDTAEGNQTRPITRWDGARYVSLLSTFIMVDGNPICSINVDFSEPEPVERRAMN